MTVVRTAIAVKRTKERMPIIKNKISKRTFLHRMILRAGVRVLIVIRVLAAIQTEKMVSIIYLFVIL